jgi:hypothetical protein
MEASYADRHAAALALVKRLHEGQTRSGGVPTFHHLARVSRVVEHTLAATGEGTLVEREAMAIAALGHDALEDTPATPADLLPVFGERCVTLIQGMTNPLGDHDHGPYVEQVAAAEEAVRLIKLSDLYDNTTGVVYCLFDLGVAWTEGFFLHVTRPMIAALDRTSFTLYPVAAARLRAMVGTSMRLLEDEVGRSGQRSRVLQR